jgi:hypothetical protein
MAAQLPPYIDGRPMTPRMWGLLRHVSAENAQVLVGRFSHKLARGPQRHRAGPTSPGEPTHPPGLRRPDRRASARLGRPPVPWRPAPGGRTTGHCRALAGGRATASGRATPPGVRSLGSSPPGYPPRRPIAGRTRGLAAQPYLAGAAAMTSPQLGRGAQVRVARAYSCGLRSRSI